MKSVLVFLTLAIAALLGPLVVASALSAIGGIGPIEMTIIYAVCVVAAVLTWRSFRRKQVSAAA